METVSFDGRTVTYEYDENGNRQRIDYNGSAEEEYTYDKNNQLIELVNRKSSGDVLSSYSYTYDLAGKQTSKTDSYGTTSYTYDEAGRILKVEAPGKTTVYTYDGAGNRISQDETYTSEQVIPAIDGTGIGEIKYIVKRSEYVYGNSNRLLKLVEKMKDSTGMELLQKITTFRYDNNGNELRRSVEYISLFDKANPKAYEAAVYSDESTEPIHAVVDQTVSKYDGFNRLVSTELIKATVRTVVEYEYNGDDLRVQKTVKKSDKGNTPEVTSYLYDRQHVILETRGNESIRYARGLNYIGRLDNAGTLSYFLFNGHGDVTQTVSEAGDIENQYDYDIFGNATLTVENYVNSIRYAGEFYDSETGLYYLRARYYDPYIGRFISEDNYWGEDSNPLSLNLYIYTHNDPINFVDPTGHWGGVAGERDDTKLSREDQQKIKELTDKYFSTKDKGEREKIHQAAERVREQAEKNGTKSKDNSDSFGRDANEKIKDNKEDKGRSYMTDKEWRELSKEHDRRSGGESKRDKSKTIEQEIKAITEKKEKSSDYKVGSKGYIEDVERIRKKSGAKAALEFVKEDVRHNEKEYDNIISSKGAKSDAYMKEVGNLFRDLYIPNPDSMKNQAIQISMEGSTIYINAYINFTGDANDKLGNTGKTYADLAIEGIESMWTTSFTCSDFDFVKGFKGKVVTNVVSMVPGQSYYVNPNQKYLQVDINTNKRNPIGALIGERTGDLDLMHVSHTDDGSDNWSISNPGRVTLFRDREGKDYSKDAFKWVAAHEFGHTLGLGDAYRTKISDNARQTKEVDVPDIMRSFWGKVSANDVEMVLEAYKDNSWQRFTDFGKHKKSDAIKLK